MFRPGGVHPSPAAATEPWFAAPLACPGLQRRRKLRGDPSHQGDHLPPRSGRVETACYLQVLMRDRRRVLPFRRADLRAQIR